MAKKKQQAKSDDTPEKSTETNNDGFDLNETLRHLLNVPKPKKEYSKKQKPNK
jgi:hypothetical protein